jgi:hypothetical protein
LSATYEAQVRIDGDLRGLAPVNADAPEITIEFVEVEDNGITPLGVKASVRSARSALQPRSPMPSSTPPAGASANSRSPLNS